jgi:hypothetical protein
VDIENETVCVDCGELVIVEFDIGEVESVEEIGNGVIGVKIGVYDEVVEIGEGVERVISKISTMSLNQPPPKNILFVDDVDAR